MAFVGEASFSWRPRDAPGSWPPAATGRARRAWPLRERWRPGAAAALNAVDRGTPAQEAASPVQAAARTALGLAADRLQRSVFVDVDARTKKNIKRVLDAYRELRVGTHHFAAVDGYGHGDLGRDVIDQAYARVFEAEAALVRIQFFSGTHAIAAALYGVLRPGDELLSIAGNPYDTLEEVIGVRGEGNIGSLRDFGVHYRQVELAHGGSIDWERLQDPTTFHDNTRMVLIQRSCGYSWRPSLTIDDIRRVVRIVKSHNPNIACFVDNCYGEFVEDVEPTHPSVGADLIAGSLIKNCGGTLALSGGYVAGRRDLVAQASARLSAPGVSGGATLGQNRTFLQGLFLAPQMVGEALKGAILVSEVMKSLGFAVNPDPADPRTDIIQAVRLGTRERVLSFCSSVQKNCAIGSFIQPVAGTTPGYGDEVVFADGTFVDGSTLELSADGPLREPFCVFAQGGTHWTHWQLVLEDLIESGGLGLAEE